MKIDMVTAILSVVLSALVITGTRTLPFIFFSGKREPKGIAFVERYMPPIAMTALVVASFAGVDLAGPAHGVPELAGAAVVAGLHLWKRNVLLSILAGMTVHILLKALLGGGA